MLDNDPLAYRFEDHDHDDITVPPSWVPQDYDITVPPSWVPQDLEGEWTVSPIEGVREAYIQLRELIVRQAHEKYVLWNALAFGRIAPLHFSIRDRSQPFPVVLADIHSPVSTTSQLAFHLAGDFAPSKTLTDFWVRGVKALAKGASASSSRIDLASTGIGIQQEFAQMLVSLFGTIGQQLRYGATGQLFITQTGRFASTYQLQICDQFFIIPDEAAEFLRLLHDELHTAILTGSTIGGAWGHVGLNSDGDLCYILTPPNLIRDPSFRLAEEVE
jgi:hypothetical protein